MPSEQIKVLSELNCDLKSLEPRKIQSEKEKSSPIPAFEVKKRTVFKSKKRIQETSQNFKITKKKMICNKENIECFNQSKSCKMPEKEQDKGFYLSLKVWKGFEMEADPKNERKSKSTIFQNDYRCLKDTMGSTLRTTTLDYWRKKFDRKSSERRGEKTVKRTNIFQRPLTHKF